MIVDSLEVFGGILDIAMLTTGAVAAISMVFTQLNREVQAVIVDSLEVFGGILDIAMLTTGAVAAISMWAAGPRTPRFDAK